MPEVPGATNSSIFSLVNSPFPDERSQNDSVLIKQIRGKLNQCQRCVATAQGKLAILIFLAPKRETQRSPYRTLLHKPLKAHSELPVHSKIIDVPETGNRRRSLRVQNSSPPTPIGAKI